MPISIVARDGSILQGEPSTSAIKLEGATDQRHGRNSNDSKPIKVCICKGIVMHAATMSASLMPSLARPAAAAKAISRRGAVVPKASSSADNKNGVARQNESSASRRGVLLGGARCSFKCCVAFSVSAPRALFRFDRHLFPANC